jgi:hypothetical protein
LVILQLEFQSMNAQQSLEQLKAVWDNHYTQDNFDYIFAKEQFNLQYQSGIAIWEILYMADFTFHRHCCHWIIRTDYFHLRKTNPRNQHPQSKRCPNIRSTIHAQQDFVKWVAMAFVIATPLYTTP